MCVKYVIGDGLIYSGLGWHSVDFVRLLGKDSSGLYVLKVGEEHLKFSGSEWPPTNLSKCQLITLCHCCEN